MARFKRILLKLSGESLMGEKQYGIDEKRLNEYAQSKRFMNWVCKSASLSVAVTSSAG